jgi:DNA-binding CsgD family transcriptional regulator
VGVLTASGGALETEFAFGVARQLFGGARHLTGAAAAAAPALGVGHADRGLDGRALSFELQHGLYWLTADLAESSPLLVSVDDVQWADADSLAFLAYLARRLDGLPVALLVAVREGEPCPAPETLAALRATGAELSPAALSERAVREWLGDAPAELAVACHEASGGNPFLLGALIDELGPRPEAVRVRSAGPIAVQRSVLLRLARLGPAAVALAQAVAILDRDAYLATVAALAGLVDREARAAADALIAARVLAAAHPLRFAHPVLRAAVYADIGLARRAAGHRRAAELLDATAPDRAALHLLATHPAGDRWVLDRLREAAERAVSRGSIGGARALLERALQEAPDAETLVALAQAERRDGLLTAATRLEEALALTGDARLRSRIVRELAALRWARGELDLGLAALRSELALRDRDLRVELEADYAALAALSAPERAVTGLDRAEALAGDTPPERLLLAALAFHRMVWGVTTGAEVGRLAERALAGGQLLDDVGPGHPAVLGVLSTLQVVERDADVEALIDAARPAAPVEAAVLRAMRARLALFRGDLRAAEAAAREVLAVAEEAGLEHVRRFTVPALVMILVERGRLDAAEAALDGIEPSRQDGTLWLLLQARAALDRAQGRVADAADLAARAQRHRSSQGGASVLGTAVLALALHAVGDEGQARRLAAGAVEHARRWAVPSTLGMALRAHGLVAGDLESLRAAVAALASSPRRLEHARALVDLGAALRRTNRRAEAREPLATGMDLAHRCAADVLAARARAELVACGARPRRLLRSGVDALTPSELRVAQLAAAGHSNREIAQALFVTRKTVETHLAGIYRKLGVNAREHLAAKLQDPPPEAKAAAGREAVAP